MEAFLNKGIKECYLAMHFPCYFGKKVANRFYKKKNVICAVLASFFPRII